MENRAYSPADRLLMNLDQAVRTLFGRPQVTERANPASADLDRLTTREFVMHAVSEPTSPCTAMMAGSSR